MAENVGTLSYDVTLDTAKLINAQRDVERKLAAMGDAGDKLQTRFTAIAGAISAAISAIAIEGLVSKVVDAQRQFDVLFAGLKTMTGGVDKASAAWERLTAFAAKTPYSLEQSVQGFTKLKALGLDPSERAMTSFGNTASAMGKDLMQMIEAVADASTGEFERLKEFGIKAKANGDQVSLTFQGITTTIKNSAADITEYLTQIGETNFAGAMSERMNTLDGDISNLEDSWNALYLAISKSGLGDAVRTSVQAASTVIQELATSIKDGELTDYFDRLKSLASGAEIAILSLAGALTARLVAAMAQTILQASWAAAAMVTMTGATTAFGAVLSALGGPVGIAVTALGLLILNWDKVGNKAKTAAEISEDAANRIAKAQGKSAKAASADIAQQMAEAEASIKRLKESRQRELTGLPTKATKSIVADIDSRIAAYQQAINDLKNAQAGVERRGEDSLRLTGGARGGSGKGYDTAPSGNEAALAKYMEKYATDAEKMAAEIAKAKRDLGEMYSPEIENRIKAHFEKKGSKNANQFDEAKYLADLRKQQASEMQAVNETEQAKLREHKKLLDEKKLSEKGYAEAVTLTVQTAEDDRLALRQKAQDQIDKQRDQDAAKTKAAFDEKKRGEREAANYAYQLAKAVDPIAALKGEYEAKLALVVQYEQAMALAGIDATTQAQMARTQITGEYEKQRMALAEQTFRSQGEAQALLIDSVNALSNTASTSIMGLINNTMTAQDVMRSLGQTILSQAVGALVEFGMQQVKNAILGDTIAASKGVAYAASVSAQVEGMSALAAQNAFAATSAIPIIGPELAPGAAAFAASAASALGAPAVFSAPLAGARQYGGPVSAGSLYRVNEKGAPEMFTASNGSQFMMPTAGGSVTAADKLGQSMPPTVIIQNLGSPVSVKSQSYDQASNTVTIAVNEVAYQIRNNSGPVWSAMRGATNVQGRL